MAKTPQHRLDYIHKWQKENPEKRRISRQKNAFKHVEQRRESARKRYPYIKDERNERRRNRNRNKPTFSGKIRVYTKQWKLDHPGEFEKITKETRKKYYNENKSGFLNKMHQYLNNRRIEVLYWYSNGSMSCLACGDNHSEFLSIDHIDGCGRKEARVKKGNRINHIIRDGFPGGYQVLCHNCNFLKYKTTLVRTNPHAPYHKYRDKLRLDMLSKYSDGVIRCVCCGVDNIDILTFNHINNNKTDWFRESRKGSLPAYLKKNNIPKSEINVMCFNCNLSLGHYGYCPHTKK